MKVTAFIWPRPRCSTSFSKAVFIRLCRPTGQPWGCLLTTIWATAKSGIMRLGPAGSLPKGPPWSINPLTRGRFLRPQRGLSLLAGLQPRIKLFTSSGSCPMGMFILILSTFSLFCGSWRKMGSGACGCISFSMEEMFMKNPR